jgi:hypothetical protein
VIPISLGAVPNAQPWAADSVDVESINRDAGLALIESAQATRAEAQTVTSAKTRVHVVLGPPGSGKTHLFGRMRRKLGPRAILVHLRPLVGADLGPRYLVGQIFNQLAQLTHDVAQIDSLVGSLIARSEGRDVEKPRLMLEDFRRIDPNDQHRMLERIIEASLQAQPMLDEAVLRALLQLPILPTLFRTATLCWLGGYELDPAQSSRIGAIGALPDERLIPALYTLAAVASAAAPLVLVFDQLENLIDVSDSDGRVRAYAGLIAELVDTVPGLIIVQMAVDTDWVRDIEPRLGQAQRSRLLGFRHLLQLPNAAQRQELLERWVERLSEREQPFPWPFTASQVSLWTTQPGMTPRMLLLAAERSLTECETALDPIVVDEPEALDERLRRQWEKHLETARIQLDEAASKQRGPEPEHLADALLLLGSWIGTNCHRSREGAVILDVNGEPRSLYFLHDVHPRSIAARLRRWVESTETRVVLREKWRDFPTTWHAVQRLADEFVARPGACLIWASREDVARLLALRSLVMQARSHDVVGPAGESVSHQRVIAWLLQALDPANWPISTDLAQPLKNESPRTIRSREQLAPDSEASPATLRDSIPPATIATRSAIPPSAPQTSRDELPARGMPESRPSPSRSGLVSEETRALRVLEHLRVASLERLIREAAFVDTWVTRKIVISELQKLGSRVRWFGRAIVALAPEDPA